jgi:hypothetical protein
MICVCSVALLLPGRISVVVDAAVLVPGSRPPAPSDQQNLLAKAADHTCLQ